MISEAELAFLRARLDEDERIAREASGGTVVGEPGSWRPSPAGDEWEAHGDCDYEELLVALRPGLPRPPDVMAGYWGAITCREPDLADPDASSQMPALRHAARHDPARVLREVEAKRKILAAFDCALAEWRESPDSPKVFGWKRGLEVAVRDHTAAYSDHPGYDSSWGASEPTHTAWDDMPATGGFSAGRD